jgi:beta-glucosidase
VSLLEGIQQAAGPGTRVTHAVGAPLVKGERSFIKELAIEKADRSGFPAAVEAARAADVVVLALGEDAFQTGEGRSQADVRLKGVQEDLLAAVLGVNKKVVLVLMNGRPLALAGGPERAPAIVEAWHLGSEAGHAIADVLFGDYNPSGRLPVSFPRETGQLPLYYNHKNTGRPGPMEMVFWSHYTDAPNEPLFPFGFGLSYTTFTYSAPRVDRPEMAKDGEIHVSVGVTNSGRRAGVEVVQMYVRDLVGSRTRPVRELKGFQRVALEPGQSRDVTFTLRPADLAFFTAGGRWEAEPGAFKVFVGGSSRATASVDFTLR